MIQIRPAHEKDLAKLTEITNHYILNSYATFDTHPQTLDQRKTWFLKYDLDGPYQVMVAEEQGVVLGSAYSSRYREHQSFDQTIETSIYLAPDVKAKGIGTLLYKELFRRLENQHLHLAVAGITLPNEASIALHKKFGFTEVGVFQEYAIKNGQYISSIWMQKRL